MKNEQIDSIYGAAAHTLIDHLDFLVTRQAGFAPAGWDIQEHESVMMVVPVAGSVEAKEKFETQNHVLNFRKAVQRSIEAMSHMGCSADDCPALWDAATKLAHSASGESPA